ncbi:MAG TPA: response regulator [Patescibacteria group bacterium]|nr:response regulator [Patescibacteria group bacterium]
MKKVLIIDDDALIGKLLEIKLTSLGEFDVIRALDGDEGLKMIKEQAPDLVVLDLMMPRKSGFEVLEDLQKAPTKGSVHVLVLSNLSSGADKDRALKLGGHTFFIKSEMTIGGIVEYIIKQLKA